MFFLGSLIVLVCLVFLWGSNPVHGVLTLVVVGLGFASLLLGEGLEFSALIVVLVYVGAVTVLFIFVVMMVNLRSTPSSYVTAESYLLWGVLAVAAATLPGTSPVGTPVGTPGEGYTNLNTLGFLLYGTERVYGVFLVGGVLFVAMVAAICLSLVSGENYRTQEFYTQIRRPNGVFNLANPLVFGPFGVKVSKNVRYQNKLAYISIGVGGAGLVLGGASLYLNKTVDENVNFYGDNHIHNYYSDSNVAKKVETSELENQTKMLKYYQKLNPDCLSVKPAKNFFVDHKGRQMTEFVAQCEEWKKRR